MFSRIGRLQNRTPVIASRDDVHPGDDPVDYRFDIEHDAAPEVLLRRTADRHWLPSIQGDRATWVIASNEVLAVLAYEWSDLRFMPLLELRMQNAHRREGVLRVHFSYFGQTDPDMVYRILWRLKLRPDP